MVEKIGIQEDVNFSLQPPASNPRDDLPLRVPVPYVYL